MAAFELKIPKLSLFKNEEKMFFDLQEYLAVLESLFYRSQEANRNRATACINRELKYVENLSSVILQALVSTLGHMSSTAESNVFTYKLISKWRKKKSQMKQLLLKYKTEIEKLRECQISCWKSRSKVNKYCLLVDVAQQSLRYYTEDKKEFHERSVALNELKRLLGSKCKLHTRNMGKYDSTFEKAQRFRYKLVQISDSFEKDITDRIKIKVQTAGCTIQSGEDINLDVISRCIYDFIVHTYTCTEPPSDILHPCFNQPIRLPDEQMRLYNPESTKRIYASHKFTEEVKATNQMKHDIKQDTVESDDLNIAAEKELNHELDITHQSNVTPKKKGLFRAIRKRFTRRSKP